jgi:hypothetical protein
VAWRSCGCPAEGRHAVVEDPMEVSDVRIRHKACTAGDETLGAR